MRKILLVDDEEELLLYLGNILKRRDYEVISTTQGAEAIKLAKDARPNLILLDIVMPQMDGFEVLRKLREDAQTKNIPVLMLTGKGESESLFEAEELGVKDYIIKPFQTEEVLALIKKNLI